MSETDLKAALDAVTTVPGKQARWYAKRLGWETDHLRRALRILRESGHLTARRVWVYEPVGERAT